MSPRHPPVAADVIEEYRDRLPVPRRDAASSRWARAAPRSVRRTALRADRLRGLPQGRGHEPDRLVQGPRHDDGDLEGRRPGARRPSSAPRPATPRRRRGLRRAAGMTCCRARARRQDRARASWRRRSCTAPRFCRSTATSTTASARPRARRRLPGRAGQLGQPVPHRGPEDGRVRDRATCSATRPTSTASRSATPATSRAYWKGYREYAARQRAAPTPRDASGSRPRRRADRATARPVPNPRRSRPRSGSATPRRGRSRCSRATSPAAVIAPVTDDRDPRRAARPRGARGRLRRARVGGAASPGSCSSRRAAIDARRPDRRRHRHRSRPQGHRHRALDLHATRRHRRRGRRDAAAAAAGLTSAS